MWIDRVIVDEDQVRVGCLHCGNQIGTCRENWVGGLKKIADKCGYRLLIDEKNLKVLCECEMHRTDVVKKWSFRVNYERKTSQYGSRYQRVTGVFSLESIPFLLAKLFPWKYGGKGGWKARNLSFGSDELKFSLDKLPEGQFIEMRDCLNSQIRRGHDYDYLLWRIG